MASQEANDVQINIQNEPSAGGKEIQNEPSAGGKEINIQSEPSAGGKEIQSEPSAGGKENDSSATDSPAVPFVPSQLFHLARRTLEIADYYGEKLAYFFGITSPKYEAEIREYERRMNQRKTEKEREANEYSGWNGSHQMTDSPAGDTSPVTFAPGPDPLPKF